MTEVSGASHLGPTTEDKIKPASGGRLMPNMECKIVDVGSGAELPVGEQGEILVRGPLVMRGYFGQSGATAATIDAEGWLRTGDIGYVDADGDFFIVDRTKELIKYKALQVAPAELEALILGHPAIADACVIGIADEEAGEVPKAFVVPKEPGLDLEAARAERPIALVMEGTRAGPDPRPNFTEQGVREKVDGLLGRTGRPAFVSCYPRDVDRLTTLYRAAREAEREFVIPLRTAHLLASIAPDLGPEAPVPGRSDGLKVYRRTKKVYYKWERPFLDDSVDAEWVRQIGRAHV